MTSNDRLESFGIYRLACQLFDEFWSDSEVLGKDYRGRELSKQQVRSLDSICANIEEGYGRGANSLSAGAVHNPGAAVVREGSACEQQIARQV